MESSSLSKDNSSLAPTINPRALSKSGHNPHQSKRFNAEEWENWMQWDGGRDALSPKSPSDSGSPGLQGGTISHGSTSPSEAESLPLPPLTPVYRIPLMEDDRKVVAPSVDAARRQPNKKRKTSTQLDSQETRTRQPKGQKISHNVIEKRYRTNLNDKIARLRDSVPVLKTAFEASQKQPDKQGDNGSDDSGSDDKASLKFNKATVLTKATEYIEQLEKANARLLSENSTLRRRVRNDNTDIHAPKPLYFRADEATATGNCLASQPKVQIESDANISPVSTDCVSGRIPVAKEFQRLRAEAADEPSYAPAAPTPEPLSPSPTAPGTESLPSTPAPAPNPSELIDFDSVKGSIPVPEYISRNRVPISQQQHYAPPEDTRQYPDPANDPFIFDDDEPRAWWPRNRASKLLLGSLAGLMIMEGFNANVESTKPAPPSKHPSHHKRGMNFLPADFYTESRGFRAQIRQRIIDFSHSPRGKRALPVLMLAGVILMIFFLAFVYWSRKNPKARRRANSISSNPEHYRAGDADRPSTGDSKNAGPCLPVSTSRTKHHSEKAAIVGQPHASKTLLYEAITRLRGCWHILTTGEAFHREHESNDPVMP